MYQCTMIHVELREAEIADNGSALNWFCFQLVAVVVGCLRKGGREEKDKSSFFYKSKSQTRVMQSELRINERERGK